MGELDKLTSALELNFSAEKIKTDGGYATVNVAGALMAIAEAIGQVAEAITPWDHGGTSRGSDATGGTVSSLTESVMGVTAAYMENSRAIDRLRDCIEQVIQEKDNG